MTLPLQQLRAVAEAATPGPWTPTLGGQVIQVHHVTRDVWTIPRDTADLAYIATFHPTLVLALLRVAEAAADVHSSPPLALALAQLDAAVKA